MSAPEPIWRDSANEELRRDLDRARAIAVALEQENAELRRRNERLSTTVTALSNMLADQDADAPLRDAWARGYAAGSKQ